MVAKEISDLWGVFAEAMESILHIGPQRKSPERVYQGNSLSELESGAFEKYVGVSGEHFVDKLNEDSDLLSTSNEWLRRLGISYSVGIHRAPDSGDLSLHLSVTGDSPESSLTVTLPHVGYGISQLLPIVVQSLLAHQQTIMIEQPELHIHPRLQAELGDLFIETSKGPTANRYIVESHSETLALRLQRRIREGKLDSQFVSVLYVEPNGAHSTVVPLRLDEYGHFIDEWPDGFFEESVQELFGTGDKC